MQQQQQQNQLMSSNSSFIGTSVIEIRLRTEEILQKIEDFLRAERPVIKETSSGPVVVKEVFGRPKANDKGIQSILSFVTILFNPAVVQGNFEKLDYTDFLMDTHESLATQMIVNLEEWGIVEEEYESIVDEIMFAIRPFISRLIDNKERESYSETLKSIENNTVQQRTGLFNRG